jgi:putative nucleotidyltransferase with HDIG domain
MAITVAVVGLAAGVFFWALNYVLYVPVLWLRRGLGPLVLWREGVWPFLPFHFFFLSISLGLIFIYRYYVLSAGVGSPALLLKSTLLIVVCLLPVMGLIYAFRAYAHQRELAVFNARLAARNERLALQAVASQVTALDLKDNYTARHSAAVAQWSTDIAERLELGEHEVNVTHLAALLHDVGKIGVPDEVLNAPGKLDPVAWALVETHSQNGEKILNNIDQFDELAKVVLYHHERYDGSGYPNGAAGDEIPFISRIICVADSYSAMVSDRPYRKRLPVSVAKAELEDKKGIQFDPRVVDTFLALLETHDEKYQQGEAADFRVEFQKVKFLRDLPAEVE